MRYKYKVRELTPVKDDIVNVGETLKINYNNISKNINATFIRAPKIIRYGSHINVLAYYNEIPCAVKSGLHVGLSFHPELNNVSIFHEIAFDTLINKKEDLYAA